VTTTSGSATTTGGSPTNSSNPSGGKVGDALGTEGIIGLAIGIPALAISMVTGYYTYRGYQNDTGLGGRIRRIRPMLASRDQAVVPPSHEPHVERSLESPADV
jgi:hypothetical protein